MTAKILDFRARGPARPWVEIVTPGATKDGRPYYFVDIIETGERSNIWDGHDLAEARIAAAECGLPIVDRIAGGDCR